MLNDNSYVMFWYSTSSLSTLAILSSVVICVLSVSGWIMISQLGISGHPCMHKAWWRLLPSSLICKGLMANPCKLVCVCVIYVSCRSRFITWSTASSH